METSVSKIETNLCQVKNTIIVKPERISVVDKNSKYFNPHSKRSRNRERKVKLYERGKMANERDEKIRLRALNAKFNRDRKMANERDEKIRLRALNAKFN